MRKTVRILLLGALFAVLLCGSALAADSTAMGIHSLTQEAGITGLTLTAQKADGVTNVTTPTDSDNGTKVYTDTVRIAMTYTGVTSGECLVFVLDDDSGKPTDKNIVYIDQTTADTSGVSFNLYPKSLTSGKTYSIYVSGTEKTLTKVGSFGYYAPYKLGDVDNDGSVNATDAMIALQIFAKLHTPVGNEFAAANVDDSDNEITATDAMMILQIFAHIITV